MYFSTLFLKNYSLKNLSFYCMYIKILLSMGASNKGGYGALKVLFSPFVRCYGGFVTHTDHAARQVNFAPSFCTAITNPHPPPFINKCFLFFFLVFLLFYPLYLLECIHQINGKLSPK